MNERITGS